MPGFLTDIRTIRWGVQIVVLALVLTFVAWLINNTRAGLEQARIPTSFSFLEQPSNFNIDEGPAHTRTDTNTNAFIVAIINTLRVSLVGLALATLLGLGMGVARLSTNWLVRMIALVYIEIMQNTPLLVQLFFIYSGVLLTLPPVRQSIQLPGPMYLSVRGLAIPAFVGTANAGLWLALSGIALVVGISLWQRLRRTQIETGRATYAAEVGLAVMLGVPVVGWALLAPFNITLPVIQGLGYRTDVGTVISPEFMALTLGLVLYTGAFIAEAVRSGIQAVPKGQWEASRSQGFGYLQTLRLVVLPQALRVIIPPLTNQYLNLIKNSSLGAAIGFAELFAVARTMQQSVPVIPVVVIVMTSYLTMSLLTAFIMNVINARVQIRTR